MDDGQLWFDFAWSAQWARAAAVDPDEPADSGQKYFSQMFPAAAGRALSKVISVAPDGAETEHWQCRDRATARRLAEHVAAHAPPGERVKVRRTLHLVRTIDVDEDVPPPKAA